MWEVNICKYTPILQICFVNNIHKQRNKKTDKQMKGKIEDNRHKHPDTMSQSMDAVLNKNLHMKTVLNTFYIKRREADETCFVTNTKTQRHSTKKNMKFRMTFAFITYNAELLLPHKNSTISVNFMPSRKLIFLSIKLV